MTAFEQYIFDFLLSYSSQPLIVYSAIVLLMTAGSFGLPISEEIVIIVVSLIAFIGTNAEVYSEASSIDSFVSIPITAAVCFLSVFLSDVLVYLIGRLSRTPVQKHKYFHRLISKKSLEKISRLIIKHGYFYPAVLRFTPGIRVAGHFSCGFFRIPFLQFALVDGITTLLVVPTQVFLIGIFGHSIVEYLREFIFAITIILFIFIAIHIKKIIKTLNEKEESS